MICVILTGEEPLSIADKVVATAVNRARLRKTPCINIVFLSTSTNSVFKYKEVFTKYIDVGVRVFMESDLKKLKHILIETCKSFYIPSNSEKVREQLKVLGSKLDVHVEEI